MTDTTRNESEAERLRREAAELFAHADALEQETNDLFGGNVACLCMSDTEAGRKYREKIGDRLERQLMDAYRSGQRVFRMGAPRTTAPDVAEPARTFDLGAAFKDAAPCSDTQRELARDIVAQGVEALRRNARIDRNAPQDEAIFETAGLLFYAITHFPAETDDDLSDCPFAP